MVIVRCCIVLISLISFSDYGFSQRKNIIYWKDTSTLSYDDFKTKRYNGNTWAEVDTYFHLKPYSLNNIYLVDAIAMSNSNKNYFSKAYLKLSFRSDSLDKEVIRHENYHFNITEIYCRYIERDFYEFIIKKPRSIRKINAKISKLYWRYLSEWDTYETNFDICTQHGNDIQEHEKWIAEINSELENLKQFENVTIKLIKQKKKYVFVGLIENVAPHR